MSVELLSTFETIENVVVVGRRWFDRINGNTYHSAEIYVNGRFFHKIDCTYGYGNMFEYNAWVYLKKHFKLKNSDHSMPSQYCRENGISWNATVSDVKRKRDL